MELTVKKVEQIYCRKLSNMKLCTTKDASERDEVLAHLYYKITNFIEDRGFILHEDLISICDRSFKSFGFELNYDKNKFPDDRTAQFEYITDCLLIANNVKTNNED